MPTKDGFNPDQRLPIFLDDEAEQEGIGRIRDRAVLSSRVLIVTVWAAAAAALAIALLSVEIPARVFTDLTGSITDVTASLVNKSALQPGADPSTPAVQYAAGVAALVPTATDASREEIAAVSEIADQRQPTNSEPASESLFSQFQAWAAQKEAQAQVEPVQSVEDTPTQVVQDAPAPVAQNAPAEVATDARTSLRPMQKRRHARALHNARAEMPSAHHRRNKVSRKQYSRVPDPPAQEARAQAQGPVVQSAPAAPSFLPTFGWSN